MRELIDRFSASLERLANDGRDPVPPLRSFSTISYGRADDPPPRPVAAFSLLNLDASGFQPFDTARKALTVAGMMRGATKAAAERGGWPESKILAFILGHGQTQADTHVPVGEDRFAYIPMPSIESRGPARARVVGSVRRVMLTSFCRSGEDELRWARRNLSGQELVDERTKEPAALLSLISEGDSVVRCYRQAAY